MFTQEECAALGGVAKGMRLLDPSLERVRWACHTEDVDYLIALLQNGAPTHTRYGADALLDYCNPSHIVAALLDNDRHLTPERLQRCMYLYLMEHEHHDVVQLLWERGVRPSLDNIAAAIMQARDYGCEILGLLKGLGWNINTKEESDQTLVDALLDHANFVEMCRSWRHCYCYMDEMPYEERCYVAETVIPWLVEHGAAVDEEKLRELRLRVNEDRARRA